MKIFLDPFKGSDLEFLKLKPGFNLLEQLFNAPAFEIGLDETEGFVLSDFRLRQTENKMFSEAVLVVDDDRHFLSEDTSPGMDNDMRDDPNFSFLHLHRFFFSQKTFDTSESPIRAGILRIFFEFSEPFPWPLSLHPDVLTGENADQEGPFERGKNMLGDVLTAKPTVEDEEPGFRFLCDGGHENFPGLSFTLPQRTHVEAEIEDILATCFGLDTGSKEFQAIHHLMISPAPNRGNKISKMSILIFSGGGSIQGGKVALPIMEVFFVLNKP